jgi:hypothetical protein
MSKLKVTQINQQIMKKVLLFVFSLLLISKLYAQERKDKVEPIIEIEILATSKISDDTKIWKYDRKSGKWKSYPSKNPHSEGFGYFNVIKFLCNNKLYYAFAWNKAKYNSFSIEGIAEFGTYGYFSYYTHCFIITEDQNKTLKMNLFKKDGKPIRVNSVIYGITESVDRQEKFLEENTLKYTLRKIIKNPSGMRVFSLNSQIINGESVVRFTLPQQNGTSLKKFYFETEMNNFMQFLIE